MPTNAALVGFPAVVFLLWAGYHKLTQRGTTQQRAHRQRTARHVRDRATLARGRQGMGVG